MKRILLSSALVLLLLSLATGLQWLHRQKRQRFESFLEEQYRKAPVSREKGSEKEAMADQPDIAAYHDYLLTLDPKTGMIPRDRLLMAYRETRATESMKSTMGDLAWEGTESVMGGRTRAIMYDPNDPNRKKVWAGGVTGGLWYNDDITNAYSAWIPVGDFWPILSVRCITSDPNNPQVFYVGTGEPETAMITYRESSGLGQGIWKSADGGTTWEQILSTTGFDYITDILVRNEGGTSVIYAGVVSGTYHGIHQSQPSDGLFRSADGGATWTQVLPDITGLQVPFSPSDIEEGPDGRIYVGSRPNLNGDGGATLLYSDTGLPGSWVVNETYRQEIENDPDYNIPGRVVIASAKSDPNIVYALIASGFVNPANGFNYFYCFHILRSTDKGVTWTKKNLPQDLTSGINFATIAWHALDIAVDPNNPDHIYIGGLDMHHSLNGGASWNRVSDWSLMYYGGGSQYIHADQHIILFKPGSSDQLLFGSDGGVFYTMNGTAAYPVFQPRNNGYNTLQYYTCAIHPNAGVNRYYGGLQDNGSLYYTGDPLDIDAMVSGGDGACCFYDENEPNISMTSIYYNQYYIYNYATPNSWLTNWSSGTFVSPADYDYLRNTIYANAVDYTGNYAGQILRLTDILGAGNGEFIDMVTGSTVPFSAVKYSQHSSPTQANLFLGTASGRIFKAEHAESSPYVSEITGTNLPVGSISSIAVGKSEDTLLVTYSNYGVTSVWLTTNGGLTWTDKEGNLPDMPIRWAVFHPENSRYVMLATETGVWVTGNLFADNVTWEPQDGGMANVRVDMLQVRKSDNTVLAATHGRGLFTTIWDISDAISSAGIKSLTVFPNPTPGKFSLRMTSPAGDLGISVLNVTGQVIYNEKAKHSGGDFTRTLDLSGNEPGTYFVSVRVNGTLKYGNKILKF